jgi:hypothetical protein
VEREKRRGKKDGGERFKIKKHKSRKCREGREVGVTIRQSGTVAFGLARRLF